jgi:hypothetical protein
MGAPATKTVAPIFLFSSSRKHASDPANVRTELPEQIL